MELMEMANLNKYISTVQGDSDTPVPVGDVREQVGHTRPSTNDHKTVREGKIYVLKDDDSTPDGLSMPVDVESTGETLTEEQIRSAEKEFMAAFSSTPRMTRSPKSVIEPTPGCSEVVDLLSSPEELKRKSKKRRKVNSPRQKDDVETEVKYNKIMEEMEYNIPFVLIRISLESRR